MKKIFSKAPWYLRVILSSLGIMRKYKINDVEILIDYTHRLPDHQRSHTFYDRFLPQVVKNLSSGSYVIDIGANIGDTVAAMVSANKNLEYICIEADEQFYMQLLRNIKKIKIQIPNTIINPIKALVGLDVTDAKLDGAGGTKHAIPVLDSASGGGIKSETLENIIRELEIDNKKISLLKTDVDGFDFDVIASAGNILDCMPLIYFECMYETSGQLSGYKNLFQKLIERGYTDFAFFDNFGQYILTSNCYTQIDDMIEYVRRQNSGVGTRTMNYYDILCFNDETRSLAVNSIAKLNEK